MSSIEQRRARIRGVPDIGLEMSKMCAVLPNQGVELTLAQRARFEELYREHFDFVFRNLRRLGVNEAAVDDALQEVYLVALRRIEEFQPGTHAKAWLFAIAIRVASNQRRGERRRGEALALDDAQLGATQPGPFELTARAEARRMLHAFLGSLDEQRRAVFIMAELEQMTAPEISRALSANLNTVYSWLRTARLELVRMLETITMGEPRG